ncbi:MAG: hypothetical protein KAI71_05660 [Candidatus Pacebacteria bacterium]|nr:hypothetical protein [Candidatus Paceibacterota bacterium]
MKRKTKKNDLVNAQDDQCFWVCNGSVLRNIKDLKDSLSKMDKETFLNHVNKEKNDFATWVKEILEDETLSKKISKNKTVKTMIKTINDRLKKYR